MRKILLSVFVVLCAGGIAAADPARIIGEWYPGIFDNKTNTVDLLPEERQGNSITFQPDGKVVFKKKAVHAEKAPKFRWRLEGDILILSHDREITMMDGKKKKQTVDSKYSLLTSKILLPENGFILFCRGKEVLSGKDAAAVRKMLEQAMKNIFGGEDHFADKLKLPENIQLHEPEENNFRPWADNWGNAPENSFQQKVVRALRNGKELPDDAVCAIPSLTKLQGTPDEKAVLLQYLAANPEWHLYRERYGQLYAVRQFRNPETGEPQPELHHFYSWSSPGETGKNNARLNNFRFGIGLEKRPWNGSLQHPRTNTEHNGNEWVTRFLCGDALVEINDSSQQSGRRMTAVALDAAEKEFAKLAAQPENWKKLLPADAVRKGKPDIRLKSSYQGGIYQAVILCNPGEPGDLYLRAFEITHGTPLSAERLAQRSNVRPGWSADPLELFAVYPEFTIYEGEWEQFYGARFQVWFKPDSGQPERKLMEKDFKIQGWSR